MFTNGFNTPATIPTNEEIQQYQSIGAVSVEDCGAVGNGVISDSVPFEIATGRAIQSGHPAIELKAGKTYLLKADDIPLFKGVSIYGNGATLKLDGLVRFDLSLLTTFICKDLIIETNYGCTEDEAVPANCNMFYFEGVSHNVLYDIENVSVKCTADQNPKISRYPSYVFALSYTHKYGSKIRNLFFENISQCVWVNDGVGIDVSSISGKNIETLVYSRNSVSPSFSNLRIKNTYDQSLTWVGKTGGRGSNGLDVLMIEGGQDTVINNISGEFCIERVIYCQSDNIKANDLFTKDCAGFKFCGSSYATRVSKAIITNINKIVTDDITVVNTDSLFRILDLYYITDVEIDGIKMVNFRSDKFTQLGSYVITMADGSHNVNLKNIDCEYNSAQPLVYFFVLQDDTKTCSNINIEKVDMRNYGDSTGEYGLLKFGVSAPVGFVDGLNFKKVKVFQTDAQITGKDITRRIAELISKKAINVVMEDIDAGYITYITNFDNALSDFVPDNITRIEAKYKNIIINADNFFNAYYYAGYADGAQTRYFPPKVKLEQHTVNYKTRSSMRDTITVLYENLTAATARLYDSVESILFNMTMENAIAFNTWSLPLNVVGKKYLVEVESSDGCGKAIFTGNVVTEIYKTGNLVFDATAGKLQVKPVAGAVTDYYIQVYNGVAGKTRVTVKVTLLEQ